MQVNRPHPSNPELTRKLRDLGYTSKPVPIPQASAAVPVTLLLLIFAYVVLSDQLSSARAPDTTALIGAAQAASRYPASFGNLWYSFALALFSTLTMTAVSLAMIVDNLRCIREYRIAWNSTAHIYMRIQMAGFWVFVIAGGGDAVSLLLWGEVSAHTMELVLAADRYLDFFAIVPFLYYVWLRTRSQPTTLYYLQNNTASDTRPTFGMVARHAFMVGLCALSALLVALSK